MATPKPGEIRCPTCHRSTMPAAFCTQCGSAIPEDARARPRGMDRDELQDRIRQRRAPGDPYRRGGFVGDAQPGYERFEPDPQDAAAVRPEGGAPEGGPRADYFEDRVEPEPSIYASPQPPPDITHEPEPDRWEPRSAPRPEWDTPAPPPAAVSDAIEPEPSPWGAEVGQQASVAPQYAPQYEDGYEVEDEGYAYDDGRWKPPPRRGASAGGLAILGFLALGVLALLGGAFLAGVFSGEDGVAGQPTPTPGASVATTPEATPEETPGASGSGVLPSGSPGTQEGPVTFPDGAIFDVEPCATQAMTFDGCQVAIETTDADTVYAWVGFTGAAGDDTLLLVLRSDGTGVADAEFVLGDPPFSCAAGCNGYARQGFVGLTPGDYELQLMRNGEFADSVEFTVGG